MVDFEKHGAAGYRAAALSDLGRAPGSFSRADLAARRSGKRPPDTVIGRTGRGVPGSGFAACTVRWG